MAWPPSALMTIKWFVLLVVAWCLIGVEKIVAVVRKN